MTTPATRQTKPRPQRYAERAFSVIERILHIEAVSGITLLLAAAAALIWANSPASNSYHDLWHTTLSFGIGSHVVSHSLHFWVNDALMTVFFLVVGMEIRREIHEGALSNLKLASLPLAAALGGVAVPALVYFAFNGADPILRHGWAVPTATDIAFAVGVLALLGRSIPGSLRIFLLAVAIIDDIAAVLIIALFYSGGLDYTGLLVAGAGIAAVLMLQRMGIGSAWAYILPGAILWAGLLQTGAHPTLAGVVLGLMTPVLPRYLPAHPVELARRAVDKLDDSALGSDPHHAGKPLKTLRIAQREFLPPVTRVQMALHPWVAYGVMPIFALANAGVTLEGFDLSSSSAQGIMLGIIVALVVGKPLGLLAASWIAVRLGLCSLPPGVNWSGLTLVGLLAGIGFTMSIFIATLAFNNASLLGAAKLGVLIASCAAAVLGLAWGVYYKTRQGANAIPDRLAL
ncbi:Na+/H+ antiporter NhaA [Allopusillimonas ginsengisoli]|uniref:Na+/H+ antiporter NhaA n=1 Tax=Allopusillimonas ginsengisoli TaxID=453575 RepID=UPI00101EF0C2|nr:Na+/H+ antiporter NhaA [Allopusillimonas ginsengisoli]TEA78941.1 Na+/H+ antiporter NhaA [Allopusillimonas ginsengisoli]